MIAKKDGPTLRQSSEVRAMSFNFAGVVRGIPKGVGHIFRDTVQVFKLKRIKDRALSRREVELIRSNTESLKKVGIFIVLQAPPVIGLLPIAAAVTYPRQILTYHFWSEEQKDQFLKEEHIERKIASQWYSDSSFSLKPSQIPICLSEWVEVVSKCDDLALDHHLNFDKMARSHGMFSTDFAYKAFPDQVILRQLRRKVLETAIDDVLLIKEGTRDLERRELQWAAVRRGIDPTLESDEIAHWLNEWLHRQIDDKQFSAKVAAGQLNQELSSALAHMVVGNQLTHHAHPSLDELHPKY